MIALALALFLVDATPPLSAQDHLASLKDVYEKSCRQREYGAYDDICETLRNQIREAQKAADRERLKPTAAPPPPRASDPPQTPPRP